ncbi:FMN-binding negative transcriptional regulator [Actinoplanes sp. NPDC051470]|uniref:FMN-binding negative transcriptional regulator n=1 Tax=unclassified Actinoplanes TaxID=2626549 RepID=UPI003431DAF6
MFVPKLYRTPDPSWALALMRGHPLAMLVGNGADGPLVTHLPVIPDETTLAAGTGETGLVGTTLLGHLNRANPHWKALAAEDPVTLVFHGPHGYVSPTVYQTSPAAPTWNFTALHVHGTVELITGLDATLWVVRETVRILERDFGTGWDPTTSLSYFEQIGPGVGAFRIRVTAAEAMFKLSQEKAPEVRSRVARSFNADPSGLRRELAETMIRWS